MHTTGEIVRGIAILVLAVFVGGGFIVWTIKKAEDPAAMARQLVEQGAECLHLVDLDGARDGEPANLASIRAIRGTPGKFRSSTHNRSSVNSCG